ncbi:MAG: putative bifunctional diguanylate cyclase/phosphodiesterase [Actinomycetes bacterium]
MQLLGPAEMRTPDGEISVLLVEDSDADAELSVEALEHGLGGVSLTRCVDLEQARSALAGSRFDVVVLDLGLPDRTGLQRVSALRSGWPDLPLVVLTADAGLSRRAMAAGAHDVLVKGADDGRSLATAVQHAVDRARFELATARYERIARSLLDAIESPTCAVDGDGVVVAVNAAWQRFGLEHGADLSRCGEGADYLAVCRAAAADGDETAAAVADGLLDVLAGRRARFERDYACVTDDRWFSVRITPMNGMPGAVISHVDVTAAKAAEDRAQQLALHDGLTGLPNRLLLRDRLEQALSEASRHGSVVAVALIDLDHFKRVNDSLGHAVGDALLTAVAERLSKRLRTGDTLARLAGDEFVVVWRDVAGDAEVEALAGRLEEGLHEPFDVEGTTLTVTASVGVVVGRPPQTGEELLQAADAAMYDAKARGRARRRLYGPELERAAVQRTETSADLQDALERGELVLHYQPVVDLTTGAVTGVEALVRWEHPERGLLGPASFLPVAEATGLVVPLGREVLRQACAEAARWPDGPGVGLDVEVNLSPRQMSQPDVVRSVREALEESGLSPHRLVIDVTESAVMDDAGSTLHDMAALGVRIAVDDFGTGYSSLQQLTRYPVGTLKVDRTFVAGMGSGEDDDAIVSSVVGLAHAVGARCVAEGVETVEQATALRLRGCELAQGNLFSPAVPAAELAHAIDRSRAAAAALSGSGLTPETLPAPDVTARIRALHASGASLHTIAAALNRSGAEHPAGLRWHARAVGRVLADVVETAFAEHVPRTRASEENDARR